MRTDESAENAVRQLVDTLFTAWNAHDAQGYAAAFAPDADFTNVFGIHDTGREAVPRRHFVLDMFEALC